MTVSVLPGRFPTAPAFTCPNCSTSDDTELFHTPPPEGVVVLCRNCDEVFRVVAVDRMAVAERMPDPYWMPQHLRDGTAFTFTELGMLEVIQQDLGLTVDEFLVAFEEYLADDHAATEGMSLLDYFQRRTIVDEGGRIRLIAPPWKGEQ